MSPPMIIILEFLMLSFVVIMVIAAKTNQDAHKCVYPIIPFCYLDWKCPAHTDDGTTTNMLSLSIQKKKELNKCVSQSNTAYSKESASTCGCRDPSYVYSGSDIGYEPIQQTFGTGTTLNQLVPGSQGATLTLGNTGKQVNSDEDVNVGPVFCIPSGNMPTNTPVT